MTKTLWQKKRSNWYRDAERSRIFEDTQLFLPVFFLAPLALLSFGLTNLDSSEGYLALAGAPAILLLWRSLLTGREWARLVCGGGLAAVALLTIVAWLQTTDFDRFAFGEIGFGLIVWGIWVFAAYDLLGPGAKERFRRARVGLEEENEIAREA